MKIEDGSLKRACRVTRVSQLLALT